MFNLRISIALSTFSVWILHCILFFLNAFNEIDGCYVKRQNPRSQYFVFSNEDVFIVVLFTSAVNIPDTLVFYLRNLALYIQNELANLPVSVFMDTYKLKPACLSHKLSHLKLNCSCQKLCIKTIWQKLHVLYTKIVYFLDKDGFIK